MVKGDREGFSYAEGGRVGKMGSGGAGDGLQIIIKILTKTLLTKVFPYAILIFAYDEGEDIVDKPGGK